MTENYFGLKMFWLHTMSIIMHPLNNVKSQETITMYNCSKLTTNSIWSNEK